jgi:hypothetical protein
MATALSWLCNHMWFKTQSDLFGIYTPYHHAVGLSLRQIKGNLCYAMSRFSFFKSEFNESKNNSTVVFHSALNIT